MTKYQIKHGTVTAPGLRRDATDIEEQMHERIETLEAAREKFDALADVVESIRKACENNAAPVNLMHALTQIDRVSLSADLLNELFEALREAREEVPSGS